MENRLEASNKPRLLALILFLAIAMIVVLLSVEGQKTTVEGEQVIAEADPGVSATMTPETTAAALKPAPTQVEQPAKIATVTSVPSPSPSPTLTVTPDQEEVDVVETLPAREGSSELIRYGVTGGLEHATSAFDDGLLFGSLLNWHVEVNPPERDIMFWQMVRTSEEGIRRTTWEEIEQAVQANPGSFWLVGNEPDVPWQDNVTPQRYAEIYHEVYTFIKSRDPSANIVIGGVSQPTPLRRAYLDLVLDAYLVAYDQPMPVDVWNVHAFTLREERGSWGVDIPPGMDESNGILYEIEDHDNLDILEQNLVEFRAWMADRGYGDKPLVVSEYGILMPEDYGFPPETVGRFLTGTFDLFQTMANETGYLPDDGRLVQWWFWYSVYDEGLYQTGNLYDWSNEQLTTLGQTWTKYVSGGIEID